MPKIDMAKALVRTTSIYPAQFAAACAGREKMALGNVAGLTQFGVNLTRLKPGAASALRHWHRDEDEFIYVLEGELTLVEDDGETTLQPGEAAGFKAGVANGHQLINRTKADALYLEIGTRSSADRVVYPDTDMIALRDEQGTRFVKRSGEAY